MGVNFISFSLNYVPNTTAMHTKINELLEENVDLFSFVKETEISFKLRTFLCL